MIGGGRYLPGMGELREVADVRVPFSQGSGSSVCHIMPLLVRRNRYAAIKQALRDGGIQKVV
jgi:hypothetical protein